MSNFYYQNMIFAMFFFAMLSHAQEGNDVRKCHKIKEKPIVVFIVPDYKDSPFWKNVGTLAIKASQQLNIDLRFTLVPNFNRSRFNYVEKIEKVILANQPSDYLVAPFLYGTEDKLITMINKHQIKFISYNSPLSQHVKNAIGTPRTPYKNWLAHISPDDEQAGYDAAKYLVSNLDKIGNPFDIIAINGGRHSEVAKERNAGLERYAIEHGQINLLQTVNTDWSSVHSKEIAAQLLKRFKSFDAVWTASDVIAISAYQALEEANIEESPLIAGIDWTKEITPYIKSQKILASFGGHVFEGVWVLTLIRDHFSGKDFIEETGGVIHYPLRPINKTNLALLNKISQTTLDATLLSKCLSNQNKTYQFDPLTLLL